MNQARACERYGLPANTPFSRIERLYRFTSEQRLLQVWVPSAHTSAGSVSVPQMVQRCFLFPLFLARSENFSGLVGFIGCLPPDFFENLGAILGAGYGTIRKYPMCFGRVSAHRALVRECRNHLGEFDGCHDVHFFLLENIVG